MANPDHIKWLRKGVDYWNALRNQRYFLPDFSGTDLRAELMFSSSGTSLDGINLRDGNFDGASLRGISLEGANLQNARFNRSSLQFVNFRNANLWRADLTFADLRNADFSLANLSEANLSHANLKRADLRYVTLLDSDITATQPLKSYLFPDISVRQKNLHVSQEIKGIGDLLKKCEDFQDYYSNCPTPFLQSRSDYTYTFYFRGERNASWELRPSVMRSSGPSQAGGLREKEGEMLLDLMSQRPGDFTGVRSALSQWVLAQHHGLKTRFLDITHNPLVALFHACEPSSPPSNSDDNDGVLHVFAVPKILIKTFDSDSIGIIANLAKLTHNEQKVLTGRTSTGFLRPHYTSTMRRLYHFIMQEKPYFEKRINIRDLFRVFVVEPERSFEKIRAQSGAFLVSAFHERFERDEILKDNKNIPVYDYYRLSVPRENKEKILRELRLLNITREVLFPSLDEVAKAIVQRNS